MNIGPLQFEITQSARVCRLKEAVLASFHEPAPSVRVRLSEFSARDWNRAKYWLDVSGLALYFLERLVALNLESCVPEIFLDQMRANLAHNRERTRALFEEAVSLSGMFRERGIQWALMKGFTLPPESVPDCAARNQTDLDFLIRPPDANAVRACLEGCGYSLEAISGATWEFKAGSTADSSLKKLYQVRSERAVEIHLLQNSSATSDRLARFRWLSLQGCELPALSAPDTFVLQGQHLFKHMCGEYTRAAWVLEYWRHICNRRNDVAFWREVELIATEEPGADVAIGAAVLLVSLIFGPCAPPELSRWSMEKLPPAICLWVQLYGRRVLLSDTPGSKLYLLLRKQINPHSSAERASRRRLLFPTRWPQKITRAAENEEMMARICRYKVQALFVVRRLCFHIVQGAHLAVESLRWQRRVAGGSQ